MVGVSGKKLEFVGWRWEFEFWPRDFLIGLSCIWKRMGNCWDVRVFVLPCVCLHVSWWYHDPDQ